ncbi:beta-glucosidase family protein [Nocardia rhamnosiphila]|uniref:Glycoside hydrolase family 3 C-terminal domain-containing protein n=1 Tax=Nocardia rhamnosiphila TaxID=426716 RepID=A0ABV2WRF3_9NOCA
MPDTTNATTSLALDENLSLGTGASLWTTHVVEAASIPALKLTDGPHGLRGQGSDDDHLGLAESTSATCFPTASVLASSWDVGLLVEVGEAIGREVVDQDVNVVLGPGVNMKRTPLCGRNFEYFSEGPPLPGKLAAAWIRGVQSTGTGTSVKHFALNSQELRRMTTDVRVDQRALHEYYPPAFEITVKKAEPTTVMSSYNRVEGVYSGENPLACRHPARQVGVPRVIVTDWGAMNDRAAAYAAGLDLEMPGNRGASDEEVRATVRSCRLDESAIDASIERMRELARRTTERPAVTRDGLYDRHHQLARRAALESGVLLKNDGGLLSLAPGSKIALIGALAATLRYQGTGSSRVNPTRVVSLRDGLRAQVGVEYAPGYPIADEANDELVLRAVDLTGRAERVIVCVGLTDDFEREGFDREHMRIPANQIALLDALRPFADRVAIVLVGGSAVEMPWEESASALLHMQLAGQAGGQAAADLLVGAANPTGKIAESYPVVYEDVVSAGRFGIEAEQTPYLESMYCGYRYFDSAQYPFGHGLSYTTFEYSDLRVARRGDHLVEVSVTIANTGERAGAEAVQLYVAPQSGGVYRPVHELNAFTKVPLAPGESRTVSLSLGRRTFAVYDPQREDWIVEAGQYELRVGASSRDIRLRETVEIAGRAPVPHTVSPWYTAPQGKPALEDFLPIHEPFPIVEPLRKGTFGLNSSLSEMKDASMACRVIHAGVERTVAKAFGGKIDHDNPQFKMLMYSVTGLPMRGWRG